MPHIAKELIKRPKFMPDVGLADKALIYKVLIEIDLANESSQNIIKHHKYLNCFMRQLAPKRLPLQSSNKFIALLCT